MIAAANDGNECPLVNPCDVLKHECFVHPSEPSTGHQTQMFVDQNEICDLLKWAIVVGDKDVSVPSFELAQQGVARQENVGWRAIQEQARAERPRFIGAVVFLQRKSVDLLHVLIIATWLRKALGDAECGAAVHVAPSDRRASPRPCSTTKRLEVGLADLRQVAHNVCPLMMVSPSAT